MTIKLDELIQNLRGELVKAEPLARLTWLRVGGPADWLFTPQMLQICKISFVNARQIYRLWLWGLAQIL